MEVEFNVKKVLGYLGRMSRLFNVNNLGFATLHFCVNINVQFPALTFKSELMSTQKWRVVRSTLTPFYALTFEL